MSCFACTIEPHSHIARSVSTLAVMILLVLGVQSASAQIFYNNGARIRVTPGGIVRVNGSATNGGGMIDNDGTTTITTHLVNNDTIRGDGFLYLGGDWSNNSRFIHDSRSTFVYYGTNQSMGGTQTTTYWNVWITGGGDKTANQAQRVDDTADFTNGRVVTTLPTNYLTFSTTGNWVNGSSLSYVEGPCAKDMNTATEWTYPVGNQYRFNKAGIFPASATPTTYRTQYHFRKFFNTTSIKSPLVTVSTIHYWHFDITSGSTSARTRLYWIAGDYGYPSYINSMSNLRVGRWDTTQTPVPMWVDAGVTDVNGNYIAGNILSSAVTGAQFGTATTNRPFTIASITADNPLPVELVYFAAQQDGDKVKLEWETASEINNLGFEIEREYPATGEAKVVKSYVQDQELQAKDRYGANYTTTDLPDNAGEYIYKLYQKDADGTRTFVATQNLSFNSSTLSRNLSATVYPNPARSTTQLQLSLAKTSPVKVDLYDISGRLVESLIDGEMEAGARNLQLNVATLPNGSYTLIFLSGSERILRALIVSH